MSCASVHPKQCKTPTTWSTIQGAKESESDDSSAIYEEHAHETEIGPPCRTRLKCKSPRTGTRRVCVCMKLPSRTKSAMPFAAVTVRKCDDLASVPVPGDFASRGGIGSKSWTTGSWKPRVCPRFASSLFQGPPFFSSCPRAFLLTALGSCMFLRCFKIFQDQRLIGAQQQNPLNWLAETLRHRVDVPFFVRLTCFICLTCLTCLTCAGMQRHSEDQTGKSPVAVYGRSAAGQEKLKAGKSRIKCLFNHSLIILVYVL